MQSWPIRFWRDERGSVELGWALLASVLVLAAVTGVVMTRQSAEEAFQAPAPTSAVRAE